MSAKPRSSHKKQLARWEWNFPLLLRSLCIVGGLGLLGTVVYFWQSSSMASELLAQAKTSDERGANKEKVKWLTRYVRLVPSDVQNLAELAFAVDTQESGQNQNIELVRSRLSAAIVACGVGPEFAELRQKLRRKIIPRLLQFGVSKSAEAEQQIILLRAANNDVEVHKWLAQSLLLQRTVTEYRDRDASKLDKKSDYWSWLAAQPVGSVLQTAVEANPDDVEIITSFLSVFNQRPSWFGQNNDTASKAATETLAKQSIERLQAMKDDGRAQLVAYANIAISNREKANAMLQDALEPAFVRLSEFLNPITKDGEPRSDASAKKHITPHSEAYVPIWDWQIAMENSRIANGTEAERICERLLEFSSPQLTSSQLEEAFLRLAALKFEKNEYETSVAICRSGLSKIKRSSPLNRLIAFASIQLEKTQDAKNAINEIESDTELRLRQIDGAAGLSMSTEEKAVIRQQIAAEQWTAKLLKGRLAIVEKDFGSAKKLLREVYRSAVPISSESRVEAGQQLAVCYSQTNEWDLAGQILSECSTLKPDDKSISMNAARAWRRAGSSERANELIVSVDDGSYQAALERAISISSKPASKVDKRAVVAAMKTARDRFEALPVEEQSSLEPWRLELFEIRVNADDSKTQSEREQDSLSKLELIAEKYSGVAEVQSLAAVDFAAFGRLEAANQAINRLQQLAERSQKVESRVNLELVKTRVCVVKKDIEGALKLLLNAEKLMPEQALEFAKVAAQIEIRENRFDKAYEAMSLVPEGMLDFDAMVFLAGIAVSLRANNADKAEELSSKFDGWINQLKQSEGEEGTNWRYLAAERLIARIGTTSNDKQLLDEAAAFFKAIDAIRPHWGLGSALGGKIESLRAEIYNQPSASEEAISLWRRALRDGDDRVSTILDLVRELNLVKRPEEADAEFQRISGWSDSVVPVSEIAVSSALRRGDFSEALAIAERLTTRKPEDIEGWILRAKTAFAASLALGVDSDVQTKRREESWSCLEEAFSRSKGISVWDARFRFKVQAGDLNGASAVVEEMLKEPSLAEDVRFLEAGRRYLVLKEFGLCRKCLDSYLLMNPRSADIQLVFADLYNAIGDTDEFLNSLRKACKAAPKNLAIRERLVLNLAFSKVESTEADLKEIDGLLANSALPSTPRSTIVGALIALRRGDKDRQSKAIKTLEQLAESTAAERIEAKRMLANYFALQWYTNVKENQPRLAMDKFESSKLLYEQLLSEPTISPDDAARFVNLLLSVHASEKDAVHRPGDDYLAIADRVLSQLEAASGNSVASLQLRIRLVNARGDDSDIENVVDRWVKGAENLKSLGEQYLWEIAGLALIDFGHADKAISWLEKVYEKNPEKYGVLVIALVREKEYERATAICVKAYHEKPSAVAASLIAEVAIMQADLPLPKNASQIIKEALTKFSDSAEFLDAMGTWQLMQRKLPEAVSFYEMAEKLDPKRRRTLNNLAMALSEMSGKKQDALVWIEKAVQIYGRDPDLLDTLGQVHFRNGRLKESLVTLLEASSRKEDVTFRIHLAQVHMAREDLAAAKEQWEKIKQSNMEDAVLTPGDKEFLGKLNTQFGDSLR